MAEYIEREALRAKAVYMHGFGENKYVPLKAIENAPAADVEVVKHSNWEIIDVDHGHGRKGYHCPECDFEDWRYESTKRCPNCGCKMDLEVTNGLDQH